MRTGLLVLLAMAPLLASGSEPSSRGDMRIRYVTFDPDEVVTIEASVGVALHIVLEPGESYVTHAFGDGKAWDFAYRQNHLFLKPVATNADSNLTVVTDRRSYHFQLKLEKNGAMAPTYEIVFQFRKPKKAGADDRKLDETFGKHSRDVNLHYTMSGDLDIAPENCWDDGLFTYFKFAGNADLPAVYMVDVDGRESIVDRHMDGAASETIVMHKVAAHWVVRLGNRALAVWNDSYSSMGGPRNVSRTASPDVSRVLWR